MTKELLNEFEEFELFAKNVEKAIDIAWKKTEYPIDLRLYVGMGQYNIYRACGDIADYWELFNDARKRWLDINVMQNETFIDIYENTPAEAKFCGVTIWVDYVDGKLVTEVQN